MFVVTKSLPLTNSLSQVLDRQFSRWISSKTLIKNNQIATQYVDDKGNPSNDSEWNPNGSICAIEGITSPDGRIFGKMAHAERRGDAVAVNIYGEQDLKIFESGVAYFK